VLGVALSVHISEFFVRPWRGDLPPKPLAGGRRAAKQQGA
jgi:hypothetical protein